ncbi:MAG: type IV secretion system DNA-binding domain-containing protein [Caulobacteraceae bacterium]|nr:type IV secretion system DNA-binding domain-containing protein [Caulobacteraceae bacterium]
MFRPTDLTHWLGGGTRQRERDETRARWNEVETLWRASPLATTPVDDLSVTVMRSVFRACDRLPALPVIVAAADAVETLLRAEDIIALEADWPVIDGDAAVGVAIRQMLVRRRRWAADFERMFGLVNGRLCESLTRLFHDLPEGCFAAWDTEAGDALGVPLIELLDQPAEAVERFVMLPYDDAALQLELFERLRLRLVTNMLVASGFSPETNPHEVAHRLVLPMGQKGKTPSELVDLYLGGTPFADLLQLPVPFRVPAEMRFEHCHIIGGTGHGKTQLLQRLIHDDLIAAREDGRSVVVIDSQGDLINKLLRLELFSPETPDNLADRLVLIDPSDIEFPAALNLFDAHLDRTETYSAIDRERVLNGVVELYETFFGAMLGAELTQKQGVIFRYLARLMITIPGATIHTLMQIMEDGARFKPHMGRLQGSARHFFATEFFAPSFAATKKQILRRLWGVLSTPAFERMFSQAENKLDLYAAMNEGKIILVSTAKDLLKQDGSALLGRFFIAMIAQAALERSVIPAEDRTPTFVYIDEAQEYFGDDVETILNQARKYRVGLTLAHQTLDQLSPRLRAALHANTSLKFAGGVSARDARAFADELHTTSNFIEGMRRRRDRTEFAAWLKNMTPSAVRLTAPLGYLERQPTLTAEAFERLLDANRTRYCGTLADAAPPVFGDFLEPVPEPIAGGPSPTAPETVQAGLPPLSPADDPYKPPIASPEAVERTAPSPRPGPPPRAEAGKGGSQHRYLQSLIRELGQQQGYRGTVEAPVAGGQVDVLLERDGQRIAFEVSVTTPTGQEAANLRKCLEAGFERVALVVVKSAATGARFRETLSAGLEAADRDRVVFLAPEDLPDFIAGLAPPTDSAATVVKGYRVKVHRVATSTQDVKSRRDAVARIVARSLSRAE